MEVSWSMAKPLTQSGRAVSIPETYPNTLVIHGRSDLPTEQPHVPGRPPSQRINPNGPVLDDGTYEPVSASECLGHS